MTNLEALAYCAANPETPVSDRNNHVKRVSVDGMPQKSARRANPQGPFINNIDAFSKRFAPFKRVAP